MTISSRNRSEEPYWNHLVQRLRATPISEIMADEEVKKRTLETIQRNRLFKDILRQYTRLHGPVAVTDFRSLDQSPEGNRFLVYSLFPEAMVAIRVRYAIEDRQKVIISIGHSIFNRTCKVNVGRMLSSFGGGGHAGAGAASVHRDQVDLFLADMIQLLKRNEALAES
jgi:nanoRNase/pAp phosphatase (c-di-AMP/oligoRNAs hydrolase)